MKNKTKKKAYDMYDAVTVPGIPADLAGKRRGKEGVRNTLQLVQHSTASMGRFDEMRDGEPVRKIKGKKNLFKDNIKTGTDKDVMKAQLRIVADKVHKKEKGITNSLAPYEGIIPDAPSDSFKKRKGKGSGAGKNTSPAKKQKHIK